MQVKKVYWLSEIEVQVNKRELIFDNQLQIVYYAYNGINKWHFDNFTGTKWLDKWHRAVKRYHRNELLTKEEYKEYNQ